MNIDKAIEIKTRTGDDFLNTDPDEVDEADQLSIEALKEVREARLMGIGSRLPHSLLPGETKD